MTSIFDQPRAARVPTPLAPPIADPWFCVKHPTIRGVVTYFRDRNDADSRVFALRSRFGERQENNGRTIPRVEIVDGLPS